MASKYDNITEILGKLPPWSENNEAALLEPYTYVTSTPGKEIRGAMIEAFNTWLNVPEDKLMIIARVVSMLHNASLLVDDIEDDSQLRRGQPVAHKIYGIPQTINTANYVYFLAYQELFSLRSRPVTTTSLSSASGPMPTTKATKVLPSEKDESVGGKRLIPDDELDRIVTETGGLFRIAVKLMMACSTTNSDVDYVPLVNMFGIYFQIRDDYMNLQSTQYVTNKGFAEDLSEGKFSFPVVHGIRADTSNRQVLNVLQKRPSTPTLKSHTISYLQDHTKSFDYTLSVLRTLEKQTRDEIRRLGGNIKLEGIVDALHIDGT